jgi:hypothetical protein
VRIIVTTDEHRYDMGIKTFATEITEDTEESCTPAAIRHYRYLCSSVVPEP